MGMWSVLFMAAMPVFRLLVHCGIGAYLSSPQSNVTPADARKHINKLVFVCFMPSLVFSNLAQTVTVQKMFEWWFMPINVLLCYVIGAAIGELIFDHFKPPPHLKRLVIACCATGNSSNLPLVLISAICVEAGSPFGRFDVCTANGVAYVSYGLWMATVLTWTVVFNYLKPAPVAGYEQLELTVQDDRTSYDRVQVHLDEDENYGMYEEPLTPVTPVGPLPKFPPSSRQTPLPILPSSRQTPSPPRQGSPNLTGQGPTYSGQGGFLGQNFPGQAPNFTGQGFIGQAQAPLNYTGQNFPRFPGIPGSNFQSQQGFGNVSNQGFLNYSGQSFPASNFLSQGPVQNPNYGFPGQNFVGGQVPNPYTGNNFTQAPQSFPQQGPLNFPGQATPPPNLLNPVNPVNPVVRSSMPTATIPPAPTIPGASRADAALTVPVRAHLPVPAQQPIAFDDFSWENLQVIAERLRLKEAFTPPTAAAALAIPVGIIPFFRHLIYGHQAPFRFLGDALSILGEAMIPCMNLLLGGNLSQGFGTSELALEVVISVMITRLVLLPIAGLIIVKMAIAIGVVPTDPLFHFVLLLQFTMPTAINVGTMTQLFGVGQTESSIILFWCYTSSIVFLTMWTMIFLVILI